MISYHTCPLATLGGKDTGGMNVYVKELTRELGRMGHTVDVFTRSQDEHVPHVLHDLGYGCRVVHIPAGPEVPLGKAELVAYIPEFAGGVLEFARSKGLQYDLIHSHYWMSGAAGLELKVAWDVPLVNMFHTLYLMKQRVARDADEAEGDYRLRGEQEVLHGADRIVAATPAELAQLQWLYKANTGKVTVIPPGVDVSRFYPIPCEDSREFIGVPCEAGMLLFVGRIEPLKGIDSLLEAIAIMNHNEVFCGDEQHQVFLAIIGGEPDLGPDAMSAEMTRLQAMCREYGLDDLVTFLGKQSQDTLPYYYSAAQIVVVPSHYESFGMVALEAMACGTPVVASQVGGLAFLVQDGLTGFTVPLDDPEAMADRLTRLLEDHELRERLGRQAAMLAQEYSWQKIAARMEELYRELTSAIVAPEKQRLGPL
jgi:D-inositol-3-phosphate glycosyltransferase